MMIKDYAGSTVTVYGPFQEIHFRCLNQSVPACNDPTVTFSAVTEAGEWQDVTVSLVHSIET